METLPGKVLASSSRLVIERGGAGKGGGGDKGGSCWMLRFVQESILVEWSV